MMVRVSGKNCRTLQLVCLFLGLCLAVVQADGIVVRHDRDLGQTLQLGSRYPFVGGAGAGTGTLIRPRWMLTAAHVVENFSPFDFEVRFDDQRYRVERACVHSGGNEMPWDRRTHDIALLRLDSPAEGIPSAPVYRGDDELGKRAVIVGVGFYGTAGTEPTRKDGRRRAVTNRILDLDDSWLKVVFSRPPGGTELEGMEAPGDSGGPLIIEVDGKSFVAGVGSYAEFIDAEGDEGSYGVMDFYARASAYADWIDKVVNAVESGSTSVCEGPQPRRDILHSAETGLPDTPVGRRATAYFRAFNSGDAEAYRTFTLEHRVEPKRPSVSMDERLDGYRRNRKERGTLEPARYATTAKGFFVQVHSRLGDMVFGFTIEQEPPYQLESISVSY